MNPADPSDILTKAGLWAAALRDRGQVDDAAEAHLREMLVSSVGERLDHQEDPPLVVMLCGPTAVGKSSLINALAGADISHPGLGATTRAAVMYVHEQDDPARLFAYSQALVGAEQSGTALVRHRRDELLHKVLVDTPDIDSARLQHKELTTRLVHGADLVLFVTSPEKYKVMRSARWILEQRQQRAMAFLLNKWDREALGLQHDRRREVESDFRAVLACEGFSDALIFKVSALAEPGGDRGLRAIENELPALRAWLETGISQSTAVMIRQRRLRAAWGRLAA
ncbi:MAG: GTPase, partial [Rhodopila sp.]